MIYIGIQPILLKVDGFKGCFRTQKSSDENLLIDNRPPCLPKKKPENCSEYAWNDLATLKEYGGLAEQKIEQCPEIKGKQNECIELN